MSALFDMKSVLNFLTSLRQNTNKTWFEAHRPKYEHARVQFELLVQEIINRFTTVEDLGGVAAKDCILRIYRDIRFSADKTPYRTNFSASIARGGMKSTHFPYFLTIEPGGKSFVAGGLYMPEPAQLELFRKAIVHDSLPLERVLEDPQFKRIYGTIGGERLKTAPRGYSPDHPKIELLRLTQAVTRHTLSDAVIVSDGLVDQVVEAFTALKPYLDYLGKVMQG